MEKHIRIKILRGKYLRNMQKKYRELKNREE